MNNISQPTIGKPYSYFADPYAATNEIGFSQDMVEIILNLIDKYNISIQCIVDIACGVGEACFIFDKLGYRVIGVDISEHMIQNAQNKANEIDNNSIQWLCQDMRNLCIPEKANLATCMYDSLNFNLTEADLLKVFSNVASSLENKGLFIFDIYTLHGLATCWGNKQEIHTNVENYFVATETNWNKETHIASKKFYGFSKTIDGWERWFEEHVIRAYRLDVIQKLLTQSGFKFIDAFAIENQKSTKILPDSKRALVVAQKSQML